MKTCFVIQRLDEASQDLYERTLKPAIEAAGFAANRGDETPAHDNDIPASVESAIRQSAACIVDISEERPNVWFELGFARALDKDVLMIRRQDVSEPIPFDVSKGRVIFYKTTKTGWEELGKRITKSLQGIPSRDGSATLDLTQVSGKITTQDVKTLNDEDRTLSLIWRLGFGDNKRVLESTIERRFDELGLDIKVLENVVGQLHRDGMIARLFINDIPALSLTEQGLRWVRTNQAKWRSDHR